MPFRYPIIFLLLLINVACSREQTIKNVTYAAVKTESCKYNPANVYHYSLPEHYNGSLPVVIVLDPHGNGKLAVNKILPALKGMTCMIIGSDLIRNNYGNYIQAINEIIDDVSSKPGVSKDRIYIAGFSGGARMAFEFARHSAVKGVLMCSAGPNIQSLAELPCPIYMIGGTTDFNFPETWMNPLNNQDNSNYVTDYFRGTHEWPPVDKLRQGLLYLLAQSGTQEKGLLTRESNILTASADSLWESKDYLMALKAAEKALLFNPGNKKAQDLKKKITGCKPCTDPINAIEKDLSLEYRITGEYAKMLHQKDSTWWFREIDYITDEIAKNSGNSKDHLQRIKGFLGIMFYSAIGDLINREPDNKQLVHLLAAYQKAEPENPDVYYYRALYAYTQNRKERCREFLQKARNLGFIDSVKLKKDFPPGF